MSTTGLFDVVTAHFDARPDAPAIASNSGCLDYRSVRAEVRRVGAALIAGGVGSGSCVAISLARGPGAVVSALACWSVGASFVLLDLEHPAQRRAGVIEAALATHVLSSTSGEPAGWPVLLARTTPAASYPGRAYTLTTSGSTGAPKAVAIRPDNLEWLLGAATRELGLDAADTFSCIHSLSFDFSVWELFAPLWLGGQVLLVDRADVRDPRRLDAVLRAGGVSVLSATPQVLRMLTEQWAATGPPPTLRSVVLGGDRLDPTVLPAGLLAPAGPLRVGNLYGITETTVHVTNLLLTPADTRASAPGSPIGRALPGAGVSVVGAGWRPVAPGEVGEMWVTGGGVGDGYLGDPRGTARAFVPDPGGHGARAYRSGDLATSTVDGRLHFVGRADHEMKVRGHRVAPQEVERAMAAVPGVGQAAVGLRASGAGESLVAAVVEYEPVPDEVIFAHLQEVLPAHMVPTRILRREALPLTFNGKLDRAALFAEDTTEAAAPAGADAALSTLESTVADCWATVLGHHDFGVDQSFFECGGDSLLGIRMISRIGRLAGRSVPVDVLFESPTVRGIAQRIGSPDD